MLHVFPVILACNLSVFAIIAVHECGHYLAGGLMGLPWTSMRIRLFQFPQHIAVKAEGRWLSPITDRQDFVAAVSRALGTKFRTIAFVSGGLLFQTVACVSVISVLAMRHAPRHWLISIAATLTAMPLVYLITELSAAIFRRKTFGDFSGLWKISPAASIGVTVLVLATHGGVLWYALNRIGH